MTKAETEPNATRLNRKIAPGSQTAHDNPEPSLRYELRRQSAAATALSKRDGVWLFGMTFPKAVSRFAPPPSKTWRQLEGCGQRFRLFRRVPLLSQRLGVFRRLVQRSRIAVAAA
jgi:hypothetical protein